jgi:predicted phage baseplate assembly protein
VGANVLQSPLTNVPGVQQVTNHRPATGGANEQGIEELKALAPRILKRRNRAVTREDFVFLALELSQVAKAVAIERMNPAFPGASVPGAVTVVVVPVSDEKKALPSGDLLRSVAEHLNSHRLLTTEVHVKGPEYQGVRVEVQVEAKPNASFDQVAEDIIRNLDAFLSPANSARNFGDNLIPTRLYNEILPVNGVSSVVLMNVYVDGRPVAETDRIEVPPDGLLYPEEHIVTVVPQEET